MLVWPRFTSGAYFIVDRTEDRYDLNPGDGVCAAVFRVGTGCTLRAAIQEANALAGQDTIIVPLGTYHLTYTGAPDDNAVSGDLDITDNLVITGNLGGGTVIDPSATGERAFDILSGKVEMYNLTISKANTTDNGAAIENSGELTVVQCWFKNNATSGDGGAIYLIGATSITASTFSGNRTTSFGSGGAIFVEGTAATITNCTFSGNSAFEGGAIYLDFYSSLSLNSSTLAANQADQGSAVYINIDSYFRAFKTIFSGTCNSHGYVTSEGHNIESPGSSCELDGSSDMVSVPGFELLLGVLGDYGGITPTHLPSSQSAAVDPSEGGSLVFCSTYDQRGQLRDVGTCDVGAVERQASDVEPITLFIFFDGFESGNLSAWSSSVP